MKAQQVLALQPASTGVQARMKSKYVGVFWHRSAKKWRACIGYEGAQLHLGVFLTEEDAARAYDAKATELYGPAYRRLNFSPPPPDVPAGAKAVKLTKGAWALVDEDDYDFISQRLWHLSGDGGASAPDGSRSISMHRLLMGFPDCDVDHRNRNRLDNRRQNLRLASRGQNCANRSKRSGVSSQYRGVSRVNAKDLWQAHITVSYENRYLGEYTSEVEAARAYDVAAAAAFGEFANLNFPDGHDE